MKTFITNPGRLLGLATAALLAVVTPAAQAVTQPPSPIGQWDCVMSGHGQNGIIFLNITEDLDTVSGLPTFEALFVQAGHTKIQAGREGTTGGTGRDGSSNDSSFTNLFGGGFVFGSAGPVANNGAGDDWLSDSRGHRGNWFFNSKGQTVGSFYTVLNATARITNYFQTCVDEPLTIPLTNGGSFNIDVAFCFTNAVIVTNYPWNAPDGEFGFTNLTFTNGNFTIGSVGLTNNVSFIGKVVPGKRITLMGTSAFGRFTITGVPLAPIATALPVDGFFWTGTKIENGFTTVEQFGLFDTSIQNAYLVSGQGPSYTYGTGADLGSELCLISAKKQIAFSIAEFAVGTGTNTFVKVNVRGTSGPFINTKRAIGAKGQGSSTDDPNVVKFNANLSPFGLP